MANTTPTPVEVKLAAIMTLLSGIDGYTGKVAYHSFPIGEAPALPFIVFTEKGSDNFGADNIAYYGSIRLDIELYSRARNLTEEGKIEAALSGAGIYFDRSVEYLTDEKCFETIYEIEV